MNVLFSLFVLFVANYLRINDISNNYKGVWDILFSLLFTNFAKSKKGEIMEKENIMTVDIEDFKKSQHILDYIDDDFAIVNSLDWIPYSNKIRLAGFSTRFLQRIIKMEKKTWNTAAHIHNNPVKSISEGGDDPVFRFYRDLIVAKINDEPHYYHREVMQHLFSALFCEMLGQLHKEIDAPDKGDSPKEGIKQADYTLRKFVELLSKDKGMHRSVSYYADALCYTPKHFSKVIKQACGRTPLDLINETTIEHIKYRLKRSDKSVKEIAEEFNFPNQSFFGKYVKMHLGTSPANYRNREDE